MSNVLEIFLPYMPYLALLLRVWVGANFIAHGYPKLGKARHQTAQAMKSLGIPAVATYLAAILEFFGGLFLIVGFLVPIVAFFIALEMVVTTILKKTKMKGPYLMGQSPAAYEPDITYFLLALTLLVLGAGALSVDSFIGL
jgi:putative oxidoreductase